MAEVKNALDAMVSNGELYQTEDGKYGLSEWQTDKEPTP